MSPRISQVRPADPIEWDQIWHNCPYATYFHSPDWANIWMKYSGGRLQPHPLIAIFSDGNRAVISATHERMLKGLVEMVHCSPAGTFGGWISENALTTEQAGVLAGLMSTLYPDLYWRLNPYDSSLKGVTLDKTSEDFTQVIDLRCGFDNIVRSWRKGPISRAVNKARHSGITIKRATDLKEWEEYFEVYRRSVRRWGEKTSSQYDWSLFTELYKLRTKGVTLWIALHSGQIAAGALCLYAKHHVVYWHGAALEQLFRLRPVNLLFYEVIKDCCEKSFWWFDFNPSGGHVGVVQFKKGFSAIQLDASIIVQHSAKHKCLSKVSALSRNLGI